MQSFELALPDGRKTTGLLYLPASPSIERTGTPLIVALHGGTYTATYFNADEVHSISNAAKAMGAPIVCVTRPGFGESSMQPRAGNETWIQQQGRYFHETILPAIWSEYGGAKTSTTSIVLHGHSVGGAVAIVAAARYGEDKEPKYALSGLVTGGVNSTMSTALAQTLAEREKAESDGNEAQQNISAPDNGTTTMPAEIKDQLFLRPDMKFCSPAILEVSASLNATTPIAEIYDIQHYWFDYWREIAGKVTISHFTALPGFDWLWEVNEEIMDDFKRAFKKCPRIETSILPEAPHCIELSRQGMGYYFRSLGFAIECAIGAELKKGRSG